METCRSCGAELADRAAFCSRCGSPVDAVPVLPLVGDDVEPEADATPDRRGSWRTLVGLALAVVLVLVALSALTGGDDGEEEAAPDDRSTSTTRPRTSTTRPSDTTAVPGTTPPLLVDGQVLDPAYGVGLLVVAQESSVVVDLATGAQIDAPLPPGQIRTVVWTGTTLVAHTGDGLLRVDPAGAWEEVPTGDARVNGVSPNGIVSLTDRTGPGSPTFGHVGPTGPLRRWDTDGDGFQYSAAASGQVAVVDDLAIIGSIDGVFVVDLDGGIRRIARGRLLAVGGDQLLTIVCDDALNCGPVLVDVRNGAERSLPGLPPGMDLWWGEVLAGGDVIWVGGWERTSGQPRLDVLRDGAWSPLEVADSAVMRIGGQRDILWSEDGRGIVTLSASVPSVRSITLGDEPGPVVRVERGMARSGDMGALITLVHLDRLPESWRP